MTKDQPRSDKLEVLRGEFQGRDRVDWSGGVAYVDEGTFTADKVKVCHEAASL